MTPAKVIELLKMLGVEVSRQTLTRYENQGLIPLPERGALGRGGGRWTNYPEGTVEEAYAAQRLLHGAYGDDELRDMFDCKLPRISPKVVALIRKQYAPEMEGNYLLGYDPKDKHITDKIGNIEGEFKSITALDFVKVFSSLWYEQWIEAHDLLNKTLK